MTSHGKGTGTLTCQSFFFFFCPLFFGSARDGQSHPCARGSGPGAAEDGEGGCRCDTASYPCPAIPTISTNELVRGDCRDCRELVRGDCWDCRATSHISYTLRMTARPAPSLEKSIILSARVPNVIRFERGVRCLRSERDVRSCFSFSSCSSSSFCHELLTCAACLPQHDTSLTSSISY